MTGPPTALDDSRSARLRRAAISVLLVISLIAVVSFLVMPSDLQTKVMKVTRPYAIATGLDQTWAVFAPDVRPSTIGMRARIEYANGTSEWWDLPLGNKVTGEYADYRWRKWLEYILNPAFKKTLGPPFV